MTTWPRRRLKYLAFVNVRSLPEGTPPDTEFRYLDIGAVGRGTLVGEPEAMTFEAAPSRARRLVSHGDTILSTVRTYLRAVWPATGHTSDLVVSTGFAVLTPGRDLDPRYFGWVAQSDVLIDEVVARSTGVSYPAINAPEILDIAIPVPPLPDQRVIADYLDLETARIEALIGGRRRTRRLLADRRRVLVDQALRPNGRQGWAQIPVKRMLRRIEQGWSPQCETRPADLGEWGVLKAGAANGGTFRPTENKALPTELKPAIEYEIKAGDLLVSRANTKELVASVCIVPEVRPRLLLCDKLFRLSPTADSEPRYLAYALSCTDARRTIEAEATGTSDSMQNIGQDTIRELRIWAPRDRTEQAAVADLLDKQLGDSRRLDDGLRQQIELLLERRQALVTAAVAGEFEIPGVAA